MTDTDTYSTDQVQHRDDSTNVLIVDDDVQVARLLLEILARKGIRANLADDTKAAIELLSKNSYHLAFVSEQTGQAQTRSGRPQDDLELVSTIKSFSPELPIVLITEARESKSQNAGTARGTESALSLLRWGTRLAVKAIRTGCCDLLVKPLNHEEVDSLLCTFLPNHAVSTAASAQESTHCLYQIVGKSPKLLQTINLAKKVAPTSVPVLISGESGTGKELISFLIHHKSKRALGPYIKVNCAALSDSLLDSELFGHEKGAFTGAHTQRKGRFEMAHGGTLLLDEITETPPRFQAKLLRILEQQEFERVGGNKNVKVDVRVISTTNRGLLQEVRMGRFRHDLYYRLSGVRLLISPLRERTEDLPELVWHFVNLYARQTQRRITKLDQAMMDIFAKYDWPGNVRQLRNVVLTSLVLGVGQTLSLADVSWLFDELQPLPQENLISSPVQQHARSSVSDPDAWQPSGLGGLPLVQIERRAILDTLHQTAGNQTKAAKALGISDRTLRDKIRRYRNEKSLQPA